MRVSAGTVSDLNQKMYERIDNWRNKKIEAKYPYVYLDGISLKRSWGGEVRNVSILVAIGVGEDGLRDILGIAEGCKEDKAGWSNFLRWLKKRGLAGTELFISDKCLGLIESLAEVFPDGRWQRCMVHFYRNVLSVVPRGRMKEIAAMLKAIHAQEDAAEALHKAKAVADKLATLVLWDNTRDMPTHVFGRQALPMVWDYAEANPLSNMTGDWTGALGWVLGVLKATSLIKNPGVCLRASSSSAPYENDVFSSVVTDPPYYDAVPYSDLSDFFYVWLKRVLGKEYRELFTTPLTPKSQEMIQAAQRHGGDRKVAARAYEEMMGQAFGEAKRVLMNDSVSCIMFAHKETSAWETMITGLLRSGLLVTGSWPIHTEMKTRMVAKNTAALASSVTIVCRKRADDAGEGFWDDVRKELRGVANERLDFFWSQGIRGADFFISAIGPALSVFGKYKKVVRLSGEEVSVSQFLDEVRSLVTGYALNKIVKNRQTGSIDPETQFYVVWKWSYGDAKMPADEAFKLAQALGFDTESMWDKTGVLEKAGQNVSTVPINKRIKISGLGEPLADLPASRGQAGGSPASMIDVLHRMCAFRDKGDTQGMGEFLAKSGHAKSETLWVVAQAVSEILPDGDKEKQLLQGLLTQRENIQRIAEDKQLF